MCGIAGYFGTGQIEAWRLRACLAAMHHRGPDHAACRQWTNAAGRNAYLLFTRLSIIDLDERANQPLGRDGHWIVCNGELYNYLELRGELAAAGRSFTTESDIEVLLRTMADRGLAGLDQCEGMWAFAHYDEASGVLNLSRDRFGEKPLYLYRDATGLYFGSEIKFIRILLGQPLRVNVDHLYRYLVNGYKALYKSDQTFFLGLAELPPATVLQLAADGRETLERYWRPCVAPNPDMTYAEAVAGARERLIRSVELRLRADVPLAFCMSGGVDSNALISIARRVFNYDVHGFTIVNSDARYEEQEMVACAVNELGIRHTSIPVRANDFLPQLRRLVHQHDSPISTISYYAHWLLMESIASHGYRISISGTAADELFTGYFDHHLAYLHAVRDDPVRHAAARTEWETRVRPYVRNPYLRDPDLFTHDPGFRGHIYLEADSFAGYLTRPWHEPFTEVSYVDDLLRNRMLNELFNEAVPVILHEDDLNAMAFSIENRSPYLDRALFEFCNRIPTRHLIQGGLAKAVLRDALQGLMPEPVRVNPRKVGFNAPILDFLDGRDPSVRAALLEPSPVFEHVRRDKIEALLASDHLPNSESKFLFYFINCKFFLEAFAQ